MADSPAGNQEIRLPSILIPYPGPCAEHQCHDVFVYLRPEANGIKVESTIMRAVKSDPEYRDQIQLAYLANIPGDFIVHHKIVEKHYTGQLYFSIHGKQAFTPNMKHTFEDYFHCPFEEAAIYGSFEAMKKLSLDKDQLFNLWVPDSDMLSVNGQTIKKYHDVYIVNYDIPAILHKNNFRTDIAVMIFRTPLDYSQIHIMIDRIGEALVEEEILDPNKPMSRIFHYSKGPFDQIRDAIGYLYTKNITHVSLKKIAFAHYLLQHGLTMHQILGGIQHPIMQFRENDETVIEEELYTYTSEDSFSAAYGKYNSSVAHMLFW